MSTIIFSVIFKNNLKYFNDFLSSINDQTDKDFELYLFVDDINDIENHIKFKNLLIKIFHISGSPFQIRIKALIEVSKYNITNIIFADTDDLLCPNRVEYSKKYLKEYSIICNDLNIIDINGSTISTSYWKNRLGNKFIFNSDFITDKNIIGLGNSAIKAKILRNSLVKLLKINDASDWLLFSVLSRRKKILFFTDACTDYRQHNGNIIGKKRLNVDILVNLLKTKIVHLNNISNLGILTKKNSIKADKSSKKYLSLINDLDLLEKNVDHINSLNLNYFWMEELNYLK
jgi:hypothetical protein